MSNTYKNWYHINSRTQQKYAEFAMTGKLDISFDTPYPIERALMLRKQHLVVADKLIWC